ncbi:uncharacterized protein METZ01_LOCUS180620 [marine metagenome]|uniref:Uncharacterized protein n=1 Tax=marine metagenome TaxID=408172 RepID=A0A382CNN7_9ZZZZ
MTTPVSSLIFLATIQVSAINKALRSETPFPNDELIPMSPEPKFMMPAPTNAENNPRKTCF